MLWKKPNDIPHYTDLAIFIDQHIREIQVPGEQPELEDKIYNYIWLLIKALAIKARFFRNYEDYDPFCFAAATRIYNALLRNLKNQGKVIKGKKIKPIKSCLNYIKALMYPMKIEYQNEAFNSVSNIDYLVDKLGWDGVKTMTVNQLDSYSPLDFKNNFIETMIINKQALEILDKSLKNLPFKTNSVDYKHIRMTILAYAIQSLKTKKSLKIPKNLTIIPWKLPKSTSEYLKTLLKRYYENLAIAIEQLQDNSEHLENEAMVDQLIQQQEAFRQNK